MPMYDTDRNRIVICKAFTVSSRYIIASIRFINCIYVYVYTYCVYYVYNIHCNDNNNILRKASFITGSVLQLII